MMMTGHTRASGEEKWCDMLIQNQEVAAMDFIEKARVMLQHWITHNDHHKEEYEMFANQLEEAGRAESARYVREMMEFASRSTESLKKALKELE